MIAKRIEEVRSNIFKILVSVSSKKVQWEKKVLAEEITLAINLLLKEENVTKAFFKEVVVIWYFYAMKSKKRNSEGVGGKVLFPRKRRKYIGVHFECCNIYNRVYINEKKTAYVGWCPECAQRIEVKIDKGGTDCRFFKLIK